MFFIILVIIKTYNHKTIHQKLEITNTKVYTRLIMTESKLLDIFPRKRNYNKELKLMEITIFNQFERRVDIRYELFL